MHHDIQIHRHGLKDDPFRALVMPRPIGCYADDATVSAASMFTLSRPQVAKGGTSASLARCSLGGFER